MAWITNAENWIALLTLTVMELVLGWTTSFSSRSCLGSCARSRSRCARQIGLAMGGRILLLALSWVIRLTASLFTVLGRPVSWRDLVMLGGGLFLIYKATEEIHTRLLGETEGHPQERTATSIASVVVQIVLLDLVFSLDSVITVVGGEA